MYIARCLESIERGCSSVVSVLFWVLVTLIKILSLCSCAVVFKQSHHSIALVRGEWVKCLTYLAAITHSIMPEIIHNREAIKSKNVLKFGQCPNLQDLMSYGRSNSLWVIGLKVILVKQTILSLLTDWYCLHIPCFGLKTSKILNRPCETLKALGFSLWLACSRTEIGSTVPLNVSYVISGKQNSLNKVNQASWSLFV